MSRENNKKILFPDTHFSRFGLVLTISNNLLADFVRLEMKKQNLSLREVARRSNGRITYGAVDDIVNERTKSPSIATISGLAKGLGVPEDELFDIARGVTRQETQLQAKLQQLIESLTPHRQYDLLKMAEVYFEEQRYNENKYGDDPDIDTYHSDEIEEVRRDDQRFRDLLRPPSSTPLLTPISSDSRAVTIPPEGEVGDGEQKPARKRKAS